MTSSPPNHQSGGAQASPHLAPIARHSPPPPRWRSAHASFESGGPLVRSMPPHSAPLATPPTRRRAILRLRPWSFALPIAGAFLGAFWAAMAATIVGFSWWLILPIIFGAVYGHLAQESVG